MNQPSSKTATRRRSFSLSLRSLLILIVAIGVIATIIVLYIQSCTFPTIDQFTSKLELKGFTSSYETPYEANDVIMSARYCKDEAQTSNCFSYIEYLRDGANAAHYAYLADVDSYDNTYSDIVAEDTKENYALFHAKNESGDEIYIIQHDSAVIVVDISADSAEEMAELVKSLHLIK